MRVASAHQGSNLHADIKHFLCDIFVLFALCFYAPVKPGVGWGVYPIARGEDFFCTRFFVAAVAAQRKAPTSADAARVNLRVKMRKPSISKKAQESEGFTAVAGKSLGALVTSVGKAISADCRVDPDLRRVEVGDRRRALR